MKHFLYIAQAAKEADTCKIGITDNLDRRLKEYNSETGHSKDNAFEYLFACEVKNARQIENDIKTKFHSWRRIKSIEMYSYTDEFFEWYVDFIKSHKSFKQEVFIKKKEEPAQITKIVKRTVPSIEERGLTPSDLLRQAKRVQNDEFYTRYEDVEKELSMYDKKIWKNKTILCNCDDALDPIDERNTSAFPLYFVKNFKQLKIKKLICIHYSGKVDLFNQGKKAYVYIRTYTSKGYEDYQNYPAGYDGSFDHPLSLKILNEEADIVCTNPPFSRMRDYWKAVISSGKKFLILASFPTAVTKAYIPYFKNKQVWAGYNRVDWFLNPKRQPLSMSTHWYTNLPIIDRSKYKNIKIMPLRKIPEQYKKYDDNKVLLVDNNYIPSDYKKPFAVSVYPILSGLLEQGYQIIEENEAYVPRINGKESFRRVLVQICQALPVLHEIY